MFCSEKIVRPLLPNQYDRIRELHDKLIRGITDLTADTNFGELRGFLLEPWLLYSPLMPSELRKR